MIKSRTITKRYLHTYQCNVCAEQFHTKEIIKQHIFKKHFDYIASTKITELKKGD